MAPHMARRTGKPRGRPANTVENFWAGVDKRGDNECWEWNRKRSPKGYGELDYHKKCWRAHRLAYALTYGEFDPKLYVCHRCDNPPCCNPKHLYLGTCRDNLIERNMKGRNVNQKGEAHSQAKYTEATVLKVRADYAKGVTLAKISELHNVKMRSVSDIVYRRRWLHI